MLCVDDAVVNPSDLPKLVSRVSQCSTEWSAELLRMGGIYTLESARGQWGKHGWSPVSTLLWATFFICVSHRGVNAQTRRFMQAQRACSLLTYTHLLWISREKEAGILLSDTSTEHCWVDILMYSENKACT